MPRETGEAAVAGLDGDKLYQKRARRALPLLIRQARAEQPIIYSDLAEELEMPNARNLNYVLGAIGNELLDLSEDWGVEIPPVQALVINKTTGLPGEGISWFAPDAEEFREASKKQRRAVVDQMLRKVYAFDRWDELLTHFRLEPADASGVKMEHPASSEAGRGTGESEDHRTFKEFIKQNPEAVRIRRSCAPGETEFPFGSADAIDVLFQTQGEWIGVEVKSHISSESDIARGLYQCVKYQALIEATQRVEQLPLNARVVLALESELPRALVRLRNTLGVEVIDQISRS